MCITIMHSVKRKVYFYKHAIAPKVGQSYSSEPLLNRRGEPVGIISSNKVCSQLTSPYEEYNFMPYIVNKTISTKRGLLSIMYTVINNTIAECTIVSQFGEFENVTKVSRLLLSITNDQTVYGKFILEM
jgi:hypothetical protein